MLPICQLYTPLAPSGNVSEPEALTASKDYHMIDSTNICVNRMDRQLQGNTEK
jgi:hypothetical protein